ncbi:MAG: DUF2924 domain-containing protein [Desulfovibrionaceae bacterium]
MAIKKYKKKFSESLEELKKMCPEELQELWNSYFCEGSPLIKTLWYKIMCEKENLSIEQKYITRLNKYAKNPEICVANAYQYKYNLKAGSCIEKTFRGRKYVVKVCENNTFLYNDKEYRTLSAIAKDICGHKVSGNDFFGLNNKNGGVAHVPKNEKS